MSSLRVGADGEPLRVIVVFGPELAGGRPPVSLIAYHYKLAWVTVRVAAALTGEAPVVKQVSDVRINIGAGCVEVTAYVLDAQTPQQVQRDLLAAVEAVPVEQVEAAAALFGAPAPRCERSTYSTGPEAAQRWQSGARGEHARTEEIAALSRFMENPPACCRDLTITGPGAITEDGHHRRCPTKETP